MRFFLKTENGRVGCRYEGGILHIGRGHGGTDVSLPHEGGARGYGYSHGGTLYRAAVDRLRNLRSDEELIADRRAMFGT